MATKTEMKQMMESKPVMELFLKYHEQNLLCSIDPSISAPGGANKFFNDYGYMILHNICPSNDVQKIDFEDEKIILEIQTKIKSVLEDILEKNLTNYGFNKKIYSVNEKIFRNLNDNKNIVSFVLQVDTNSLIPWTLFIKDSNKNEYFINLKNGHGVLYKCYNVENWRNKLETRYNTFGKILNKLLGRKDDTYYAEIVFHYFLEE